MAVHTAIRPALLAGAGIAALLAAPAFAQEAPAAEVPTAVAAPAEPAAEAPVEAAQSSSGVEEIVVTAQFREQNLQDTPIAITAVNSAMLEARSQTDISQVAGQAPSVTLKPQGASYGPSLAASIRGVGQYDFNPALEPGVGVYVDDVYYATLTGSIFDLLDLDRVEVLRGPQGTLAGKNSIGGALKLYSKKPKGDGSGFISGTYGSRNRIDLRGSADFKLTEDLFARFSGVAKKQDGYVKRLDYGCVYPNSGIPAQGGTGKNCVVARDGEVDFQAFRGQLRYAPSDTFEVNIIGDYTKDNRNVAAGVLTYANYTGPQDINPFPGNIAYNSNFICGRYCNYASYSNPADNGRGDYRSAGRSDYEGWGVSGQVDWELAERLKLTSISAYRSYNLNFDNDDDYSPLAHSFGRGDLSFWSFSQELRLNGSIGDNDQLEYTVGGFYMDQKSVYSTFQDIRYAGLPTFVGNDPVNADTKALFAHATFHATDALAFTGGIRWTDEHKDYTFSRLAPDGSTFPTGTFAVLNGLRGDYNQKRVDYRANAQYELSRDLMVYAQFSTGFKGGGINPRPFNAGQVQAFGPETLETYEVGVKSDLFDRKLRVNAAAFFSKYKDIQLTLNSCPQFGGPGPCALPANAGDADVQGFELEVQARPIEGFLIDAAVSYLSFDYKSISPQAARIQPDMISPYTPNWKWSFGAQYEVDLGGENGTVTPRFDAAYQSDIFTNAANSPLNEIQDYIVANGRLTWRNADQDLEISGEVTNIFDKYYLLTSMDLVAAGAGFVNAQPGRPREWAITVKKKF